MCVGRFISHRNYLRAYTTGGRIMILHTVVITHHRRIIEEFPWKS